MGRASSQGGGNRAGKGGKRVMPQTKVHHGIDLGGATKSGCSSGKWAWPHDPEGKRRARTLAKTLRREGGGPLRVYVCDECSRYHVGHLPTATRRGEVSSSDWYEGKRSTS